MASIEPSIAPNILKGFVLGLDPRIALEKLFDIVFDIVLGLTKKFSLGK